MEILDFLHWVHPYPYDVPLSERFFEKLTKHPYPYALIRTVKIREEFSRFSKIFYIF
jgi:hypothetical protein